MVNPFADLWADLRSGSRDSWKVRGAILAGGAMVFVAFGFAGVGSPLAWMVQLLLTALVVLQPHTFMPFAYLLWVFGSWWAGVDATWHWALLPAAIGVLLVHAGSALAAAVPAQATLPESVLRTWLARTGVVAALTTGVWGVAGLLAGVGRGSGLVPGLIGLVVLAAGLLYFTWAWVREGEDRA